MYLVRNLAGKLERAEVVHLFRDDEHAELAAGGDGIGALDPVELPRDLFKVGKALYIVLKRAAPGARPRRRKDVGGGHHIRLRPRVRIIVVVRLHRLDHALVDIIFRNSFMPSSTCVPSTS